MRTLVKEIHRESEQIGQPMPLLLGVTVLTSLSDQELKTDLLIPLSLENYVIHLSRLAQKAGMGGVVCSPREISPIRQTCGPDFKLVTPGIRPAWAARHDQTRITTPGQALCAGSDYIVIGRPIIEARDPEEAVRRLLLELTTSTCNFTL